MNIFKDMFTLGPQTLLWGVVLGFLVSLVIPKMMEWSSIISYLGIFWVGMLGFIIFVILLNLKRKEK